MKLKNSRKNVLNSKRQRASRWLQAVVEQMEPRTLLSTTVLANGVGTDIEFTGPFNNFMPVGSGASAYSGFSSFGFIDVPASAFELTSGVGGVNGVSVSLDNTATTGKFAPTAGSFAVYLIPNDTVATSVMRFGGPTGTKAGTNTDLNALGTTAGGPTALGVTGTSTADSPEFVGSFAIDTTLPSGYTTWNFPSSGFGAAVAAGIEADLNNNQDVRLAVVSLDNTGKADWAGNQSGETPQVQLDYNQAPLASFSATNYSVSEAPVGNTTTATITVNRTSDPSVESIIDWATSDGTAQAPSDYTAASGQLDFQPGDTSKTFTVSFNNITTTDLSRFLNLTLSNDPSSPSTAAFTTLGATSTVTMDYLQAVNVTIDQSSLAANEGSGMVAVQIDRSGAGVGTTATSVTITTADGVPYLASLQTEGNANAGRDFGTLGSTTEFTQVVHFMAGQTTQTVMIPLLDVKTFAGTRYFTATLSNPSTGAAIGSTAQTTVTITDNALANGDTPAGGVTTTDGVEPGGPYYVNSFLPVVGVIHQSLDFFTMPFMEWSDATPGTGSQVANAPSTVFPSTYSVATVDSVRLSLYNLETTGAFGAVAGNFDVYFLPDNTIDPGTMVYGTIPSSAVYIGTSFMPNNQVGYNDYTFDNLPASVSSALTQDLNTGTAFRFLVLPSAGSDLAAEWEGNTASNQPQISLLVEKGTTAVENMNVDVSSVTVDKTAGTATVAVDRTGADVSDAATVQYSATDGTGIAGTDYSLAPGTLNFAPNQTQASFTVTILNNASIFGDKTFSVAISDPVALGANHSANLGAATTEQITIHDSRTVTISATESDNATIQVNGPRAGTNGKTFLNIEGSVNGSSSSFGVVDFFAGDFSLTGEAQAINSITLSTVGAAPSESWYASGPLNVYLVSDATSSIQPGDSTFVYNPTDPEGVEGQFGTMYLLGTVNYNSTQPTTADTNFQLNDFSPAAATALESVLNGSENLRIVITAGSTGVGAGLDGQPTSIQDWPTLSINYTLAGTPPFWLGAGSGAAWNAATNTLTVTGPTTITSDPGATNPPIIVASGPAAQLAIAPTDGSTAVHLGGLTLTGGAKLTTPTGPAPAGRITLMVGTAGAAATAFSVDNSSTLDIANNVLIVEAGAGQKSTEIGALQLAVTSGKGNGSWNGTGITSSAVAADVAAGTNQTFHTTVAIADNGAYTVPFSTYAGQAVDANSIIITRALVGDSNLDGTVNNTDLVALLTHFTLSGQSQATGDFNGDGGVNNTDLVALLTDFTQQL